MERVTSDMSENRSDRQRKRPSYIEPRDSSVDRLHRPCPERRVNLDRLIQKMEEEEIPDLSDDVVAAATPEESNVAVYLCLHPHLNADVSKYSVQENTLVVQCAETTNQAQKHFSFSQEEWFIFYEFDI